MTRRNAFWGGFSMAASIMCLIQDYMGLEGYKQFLSNHWWNFPWGIWIIPICFSFIIGVAASLEDIKEKNND